MQPVPQALSPPGACAGRLISRLLWTTDACLLMTILGWVNIGVGYAMVMYMWYMCVCFWKMLHVASADQRRVARALATLPTLKFKGKTATAMGAPLLASDGGEPDVGESCAIPQC